MVRKVFNLKIILRILYDAHGISVQQLNNSCSQQDDTETKNSKMYIWQIFIHLEGETPSFTGEMRCEINVLTVSAPLCLVAGVAAATALLTLLKRWMRK